jgi:hypothetical protein
MKLEYLFVGYIVIVILRFYSRALRDELLRRRRRADARPAPCASDGYLYHRLHPPRDHARPLKRLSAPLFSFASTPRNSRAVSSLLTRRG